MLLCLAIAACLGLQLCGSATTATISLRRQSGHAMSFVRDTITSLKQLQPWFIVTLNACQNHPARRANAYPVLSSTALPNPLVCNTTNITAYISNSTNFHTLARQRLEYPWRQLVLDQASKHHQVLGLLQQLVGKHLAHLVLELPRKKMLTMSRAARDAPKQHIANVSRNLLGIRVEAVGGGPNVADISCSRQWEDTEILDLLIERLVQASLAQGSKNLPRVLPSSRPH